jgi:hypothetical protein
MSVVIDFLCVNIDAVPEAPSNAFNPEWVVMAEQLYAEAVSIWYDNEPISRDLEHLIYAAGDCEEFCSLYIAAHTE